MTKKLLLLAAAGLLAYVLEYVLGVTERTTRVVAWLFLLPFFFLFLLQVTSPRLSGRLKTPGTTNSTGKKAMSSGDPVFVIGSILYAGVYLNILFRLQPGKDCCDPIEILLSLSPTELFWFAAPILALWWYRQSSASRHESAL